MARVLAVFAGFGRYADAFGAFAVLLIVAMLIIPLPAPMLSFLLVINLAASFVILMLTMYKSGPLEFSAFPSLLLITTLLRLSLNVGSTRLILATGEPGSVIESFGEFVVGGNPVVGFVVFLILVVIQFVVITRGAERVAEVAARFTLDAMPGKQMAIDADLNAGLINEADARARRAAIQREANFYGAMDGASKFVRGDAVAGLVIVAVNLIGGFIVGFFQRGISDPLEALGRYALLTVGDGLATQIPALLISTAAGIVVTRSGGEGGGMGSDLAGQLFNQPRVLYIAAVMLALLGVWPGPLPPFWLVAALVGALGFLVDRGIRARAAAEAEAAAAATTAPAPAGPENMMTLLPVDPLEIELGYGLLPLADQNQGGDLMDRVVAIRRQMASELGLVLPYIRVRDNIQLKPTQYVVKLRGVEIAQGELYADHYLAMDPGAGPSAGDGSLRGIETREPAFGLPALWVPAADRERAELAGYTVVDPPAVLATHLTELIRAHAHELLGRQECSALIEATKQTHPAVVDELVPNLLLLGEIQKVLQNLLREGVSIRDMVTILELLADHARQTREPDVLTEFVRQGVARSIARQFRLGPKLFALTLHPETERQLGQALERREGALGLRLEPEQVNRFVQSLAQAVGGFAGRAGGQAPVLLTSPAIRLAVRRLCERVAPRLIVLSYAELDSALEVESVGMVTLT